MKNDSKLIPKNRRASPARTGSLCLYYTRGAWPWIIGMAIFTTLIAVIEVSLFAFMGNIVDWLSHQSRETFLSNEGWRLALIAGVVLVVLPGVVLIHSLLIHQTLLGNYPMRVRWLMHRYLIRQSMAFFQDEFAGRISTKLMQTALAVRETVMKLLDVLNYVIVYFAGTLFIAASADLVLMIPFAVWLVVYIILLRVFIPRLRVISEQQADARSSMTGRIVDSYTNIATVKLFSHSPGRIICEGKPRWLPRYRASADATHHVVSFHALYGELHSAVCGGCNRHPALDE